MAILLSGEGKDYSHPVKLANKVQSDLIREEIQQLQQLSDSFPDAKWKLFTAPGESVCSYCREAEQKDLSVSEAVNVPLKCTSRYGCRCMAAFVLPEPIDFD
jgi:hypothetical protein